MNHASLLERWRRKAAELREDVFALHLASADPRVPWPAKAVAVITVAYALSPIDLIPDFIPILGYVDDLLIVPIGLALAIAMVPRPLMEQHRAEAKRRIAAGTATSRLGAILVLAVWVVTLAVVGMIVWRAILLRAR